MKKILLAVLLLILAYQFSPSNDREKVYVSKVQDGDTFYSSGKAYRIAEIDAPEHNQQFGNESKIFLSNLIEFKTVEIEEQSKDKYGRIIALVYIDNENISEVMIANGMAWWYEKYSNNNHVKRLEQQAKDKKLGLWKENNPINPYKFRNNKK